MGREMCSMCHYLKDERYCDYYDVFYAKCEEIKSCPDGLDEEEDSEEEDDYQHSEFD